MGKLDFPVFDADNHLYETQDAFTRHLPAKYDGLFKSRSTGAPRSPSTT